MGENKWGIMYEQLNQRSRWYSSQVWYVPFAYLGLTGIGSVKIVNMDYPLNSLGLILLGIFSISVFVHVSSLKFFERRAVRSMQELENKPFSEGGSLWYLSFAWYIRLMIFVASYIFIAYGVYLVEIAPIERLVALIVTLLGLTLLYSVIIGKSHIRNRGLVTKIRDAGKSEEQETENKGVQDVEGESKNR